mgnify:CR=1 FL=1
MKTHRFAYLLQFLHPRWLIIKDIIIRYHVRSIFHSRLALETCLLFLIFWNFVSISLNFDIYLLAWPQIYGKIDEFRILLYKVLYIVTFTQASRSRVGHYYFGLMRGGEIESLTLSFSSCKYSAASSFKWSLISVPRPRDSFSVSSETAKAPSALDSHIYLQ